ncbi:MAG TPA: MFS transporter [Casimicrobiaceae bacterium]|nr:MFS transporter [Casimicrobiaceae bacterium]
MPPPATGASLDAPAVPRTEHAPLTSLLLNIAHGVDHLVLLVFATAVGAIAADFGFSRWEDLMPFATGAFVLFGLGSVPAGRLGDHWGRRAMMLVFLFGVGAACLIAAATRNAWQLAAALTLLGAFASIYHPVGIPMLVQHTSRPGAVIGVNGLAGNLGIAAAAVMTGFLVKYAGWRMAFVVPGLVSIALGLLFLRVVPREESPPAKRAAKQSDLPRSELVRAVLILTITSTCGSLVFNFTTNGNGELMADRLRAVTGDPAIIGGLLGLVYVVASFAQLVVGRAIDRFPLKRLFLFIVLMQIPLFVLAMYAQGWVFYAVAIAFMGFVFGAIPFTDALIVRYVDDRMRSRVAGVRLAIAFGVSSLAVWLLGPLVKANGFAFLLGLMAAIAAVSAIAVTRLPQANR